MVRSCGARKPRIAFFSPFPPLNSGISDYSASLIRELTKTYEIDLYHATGYLPELGLASDAFECIDGRLFGRFAEQRVYKRQLRRSEAPHLWRWLPLPLLERLIGHVLVLKAFKPLSAAIAVPLAA